MVTRERRIDRGRRRGRSALTRTGEEFREVRLSAGLTQRTVAHLIGISDSEYSRIERGEAARVPYETLALVAAVLGLDLPLRAFPAGEPIRDVVQLALLAAFRATLPAALQWRTEVPLPIPGDLRAWDAEVGGRDWRLPIDAESRLRDVQALSRREALKRRDGGAECMVLLVADTRHNRRVLRLARTHLVVDFPLSGRAVMAALARGVSPGASGIVLVKAAGFPPGGSVRPNAQPQPV
jgi:transcriptional regulator with XRE-family HTH domain